MRVVIAEDEINAYEYLKLLLRQRSDDIEILKHVDSVQHAVEYLSTGPDFDLLFLDIELADGKSFEIFDHVQLRQPIIFVTAYERYAIEAFKLHSIDYLLKPITSIDLNNALAKYDQYYEEKVWPEVLDHLRHDLPIRKKNRCLVKKGGHYVYVAVEDLSFVYSEDSVTMLVTKSGDRYVYSKPVEQMMKELDESLFFQINRSQIVHVDSILEVHPFLNQRYKLKLKSEGNLDIDFIVSRQKGAYFKQWLDQ